ncbi:MAG: hypothetical protein WC455_12150 [Dehalococcoidia bacterium]|jgi:hypothetical protein
MAKTILFKADTGFKNYNVTEIRLDGSTHPRMLVVGQKALISDAQADYLVKQYPGSFEVWPDVGYTPPPIDPNAVIEPAPDDVPKPPKPKGKNVPNIPDKG